MPGLSCAQLTLTEPCVRPHWAHSASAWMQLTVLGLVLRPVYHLDPHRPPACRQLMGVQSSLLWASVRASTMGVAPSPLPSPGAAGPWTGPGGAVPGSNAVPWGRGLVRVESCPVSPGHSQGLSQWRQWEKRAFFEPSEDMLLCCPL